MHTSIGFDAKAPTKPAKKLALNPEAIVKNKNERMTSIRILSTHSSFKDN